MIRSPNNTSVRGAERSNSLSILGICELKRKIKQNRVDGAFWIHTVG